MYIRRLSNGLTRIHMHDEDNYEITDDKGVNVDITDEQLSRVALIAKQIGVL